MKRILVCDDSEFIRKLVKRELESRYDMEIFNDGAEAYEHLKEGDTNFDFAIIDGEMPGMTGWELVEKTKSELGLEDLPTVILTASDSDYFKHKAFDSGVFDYLKKPFKSGELFNYINEYFEGKLNRGTVLVVEDSKVQNKTMSHQLKLKHITPISVFTGENALKTLMDNKEIDAILLDINLPGANGFHITKALKNDERFSWIPIIGITAAENEDRVDIMNKAFQSGVDDFISKPYILVEFIARVTSALKSSKLIQKLKEESEIDSLTKLYNRRTFFRLLEHYFETSKRYGNELSFIMIDIDKFKNVNDVYGHAGGDMVLKELARILQQLIRKSDIVGRFGGEEFGVIMPNTNINDASAAAEKLREAIQTHTTQFDSQDIKITISIGVSEFDEKDNIEKLIKKADDALYKAKELGRNRVCLCDNKNNSISQL